MIKDFWTEEEYEDYKEEIVVEKIK